MTEGSVAGGLLVTGIRLAVMTAESRCRFSFRAIILSELIHVRQKIRQAA